MPYYDVSAAGFAADTANTFSNHPVYLAARDARDMITPNETQRTTLIVAACYIVAIAILWCVTICVPVRCCGQLLAHASRLDDRHVPYLTLIRGFIFFFFFFSNPFRLIGSGSFDLHLQMGDMRWEVRVLR